MASEKQKRRNKGWDNLIPVKPGEVRNPNGRPKNKTLTELLRERLAELAKKAPYAKELAEQLGLDPSNVTIAQVLVNATLIQAIERGSAPLMKEVWERIDGKTPDRLANADGGELIIKVVRQSNAANNDQAE